MKCPLQFHPDYVNLIRLDDCQREECAWWVHSTRQCVVTTIAFALMRINTQISTVLEPHYSPEQQGPQDVSPGPLSIYYCDGCDHHEIHTGDSSYHYCSKYKQRCDYSLNQYNPQRLNICLQELGYKL